MSIPWMQDYDPIKEEKNSEGCFKFFIFLIVLLIFIKAPPTRLWIGLWFLLGITFIALKIWLSGMRLEISDWTSFIRKEIISGLETGEITACFFLFFWPIDLLLTLGFYFFGSRDFSFSFTYYHERFSQYNSGRGKYYGIHLETARQFAENDIKTAQETGDQIHEALKQLPNQIEKKSKLAVAFSAIMGFLTAPLALANPQEKEEKAEKKIYSTLIFNLKPNFNFSSVKFGLRGKKGKINYLSEIDLVKGENKSPGLSRVFLEYNFNKNLKAKIGHMFTPTIWFIPAPPDSPTIQPLVIINEMSVTKSGIALEYNNQKNFSAEGMFTQNEPQKPRFIGRITRSFSQFKFLLALDIARRKERVGAQIVFNEGGFEANVGGFSSAKGFTGYIQALIKPFKWLEGIARYEKSPWLESKERLLLGFSLFLEGIRFRFTWVSNELRAQATYRF